MPPNSVEKNIKYIKAQEILNFHSRLFTLHQCISGKNFSYVTCLPLNKQNSFAVEELISCRHGAEAPCLSFSTPQYCNRLILCNLVIGDNCPEAMPYCRLIVVDQPPKNSANSKGCQALIMKGLHPFYFAAFIACMARILSFDVVPSRTAAKYDNAKTRDAMFHNLSYVKTRISSMS